MLKTIANKMLDSAEKDLGAPVDEMRYILDHSMSAFRRWASMREIADYHHALPAEVYYIAKIASYRVEDCAACLQIATHFAQKNGVAAELIRAALDGRPQDLPKELQVVYDFAQDQANRLDDPEIRELIRRTYGDDGLIELAIGLASTRAFPTLKRVLGFAKSARVDANPLTGRTASR